MTDPAVPPRPAPPLPTDPTWSQNRPGPATYPSPPTSPYGAGVAAAPYASGPAWGSAPQPTAAPWTSAPHATSPAAAGTGYAAPGQPVAPVFAAPYTSPAAPGWTPPAQRPGSLLGAIALALALVAAVGATIVGAVSGWTIGQGVGAQFGTGGPSPALLEDLRILTPVRESVLVAELAFWIGTALGVWAIVQGVAAIVKRRGRGLGIAAVVVAPLGAVAFFTVVWFVIILGAGAGAAGAAVGS